MKKLYPRRRKLPAESLKIAKITSFFLPADYITATYDIATALL